MPQSLLKQMTPWDPHYLHRTSWQTKTEPERLFFLWRTGVPWCPGSRRTVL